MCPCSSAPSNCGARRRRSPARSCIITTGSLDAGPADSDVFLGSLESCRQHGLAHDVLTGAEVNARFPGYRLPDDFAALFQPDGGFVLSERAIVAHATLAMAAGAEIHAREQVLDWSPIAGGGVRVVTTRGTYEAGRLVLSPGAWIGDLVPALKTIAVPERQVLGWFQPAHPDRFMPAAFPVLNLLDEERRYYLLPIHGVPGLKIGLYHHLEERGHPDTLSRAVTDADEAVLRRCLARYFPDADGPLMSLHSCMFTNTPDEHFIIDTLKEPAGGGGRLALLGPRLQVRQRHRRDRRRPGHDGDKPLRPGDVQPRPLRGLTTGSPAGRRGAVLMLRDGDEPPPDKHHHATDTGRAGRQCALTR